MSKELLWSEEAEYVYGWFRDFKDSQEFVDTVKSQYEDGECNVVDVKLELCFVTEKGLKPDVVVPVNLTDVTLEDFYTARVEKVERKEITELETSGWLIKVGDVFSNGYEPLHLRVTKIEMVEDREEPDDAWIYCDMIDPHTHEVKHSDKHRSWYINECWYK